MRLRPLRDDYRPCRKLLTFLIQSVYADNLNWQHAGEPVMMTILGGIHHFLGPALGANHLHRVQRSIEFVDRTLVAVLRSDADRLYPAVS